MVTITGTAKKPDGTLFASATFKFTRTPYEVVSQNGSVIAPSVITATSNGSGAVSFSLLPGNYTGFEQSTRVTFDFVVPDEASADWADCVGGATGPDVDEFPASQVSMSGGGTAQDYAGFSTRADFVTWAADVTPATGAVIDAAGLSYRYTGSGTAISDLPGWVPNGDAYPDHWQVNTTPGTTDMTTAIQAAHDWIEATGGTLYFKPTLYAISATINWIAGTPVTWQGEGFYFLNDYTNTDLIMKGSVIKALPGTNANMVDVRSSAEGWVSGYPRVFGRIKGLCLWGNKSLDDAPSAVDLNSTGNGLRLRGVSYFSLEDVLVYRAAETGIFTGSYDYGDGGGARSCNNLAFTRVVAIGCGGNGMELYGGDSAFSDLVCGYNGISGANISAGPVSNSLFWNNQARGLIISSGADGVQVSNCWSYDNKFAGYYFISGGDHSLTGCRATNNGREADGNSNNQCGVLVSASIASLTLTGCSIVDDAGTQLRGVYSSGAPKINLGANEISGPTAAISISDYTNVRYHNDSASTLIQHPGFTAEGLIDMDNNRIENSRGLSFGDEKNQSAALTSNTLDCGNYTIVNLSHSAGAQTINDITSSMAGRPIVIIRNSSGITHTITHNTSKLRCLAGASISFTANTAVVFMYVSGTVWQQIGGKL